MNFSGGIIMDKTEKKTIVAYSILAVALLYIIEQILMPGYIIKSISKVIIFLVGPVYLQKRVGKRKTVSFFINKESLPMKKILIAGFGAFAAVLAAYALLRSQIDLDTISRELEGVLHVNAGNFILVGIYIVLVNAAIEEFFFRGFLFLNLKSNSFRERVFAYMYSSLLFSLYHLSIFIKWFDVKLIVAAILGLLAAGIFFNYMDEKHDTIICSYMIHACSDAAIILIGLKMFALAG